MVKKPILLNKTEFWPLALVKTKPFGLFNMERQNSSHFRVQREKETKAFFACVCSSPSLSSIIDLFKSIKCRYAVFLHLSLTCLPSSSHFSIIFLISSCMISRTCHVRVQTAISDPDSVSVPVSCRVGTSTADKTVESEHNRLCMILYVFAIADPVTEWSVHYRHRLGWTLLIAKHFCSC